MNRYFLKVILLKDCKYSIAAHKLLQDNNIPCDITWVDHNNKDLYKTENINTFPQIYFKKVGSNGNLLLGGYDDLSSSFSYFFKNKISEENINLWMNKYKWSRKSTLRLIQLIN
jgi:hypothetical protein